MKSSLRSTKELEKEIERVCANITEGYDFFNYIKDFDFGVKDVLSTIHIKKYDDAMRNYDGLQFYIAFKKRVELIHILEYAKYLEEETYEQYLNDYTEEDISDEMTPYPLPEIEFNEKKLQEIREELIFVSDFLERVFFGDALSITSEDMRYIDHWHSRSGISSIDMGNIAFKNRYNGFMGGMGDEKYNQMISSAILSDTYSTAVLDVRKIPAGYGWEAGPLSRNTIWAEVDLDVPDEFLIEGFKNWLVHARKSHAEVFGEDSPKKEAKSHFKLSFLKRWRNLRVLAFFDMKILSIFFNQSPTLKQYGDALYFDEYDIDTTEKVRKTLLPLVQEILTGHCLDDLLSKIIAEEKVPK